MNVKPKNYDWETFYDHIIDITSYTFSYKSIYKRVMTNSRTVTKGLNFVRAISHEGTGRIKFFKQVRENLRTDPSFRAYFEGEHDQLPDFYLNIIKKDLGYMWKWLPEGAVNHDHLAYLHKQERENKSKENNNISNEKVA